MPSPATDRQPLYLGAAAVAFAAVAVVSLRAVGAASAVSEKALPARPAVTRVTAAEADSGLPARAVVTMPVIRRDPFASAGRAPTREPKSAAPVTTESKPRPVDATQWVVSSILFEANRRSAIVNNAWVTVGDPVGGGARLSGIERKHVVVTDPNGIQHIVPIRRGEK
jgi:hypothetical protein